MRPLRPALLLLLLLPVLSRGAAAQAPQVQVGLSPHGPTVGDRVEAVLRLRVDAAALAAEPRFPAWQESWGEATIVEAFGPERLPDENGAAVWRQRVILAAFRPGEVELPPRQIAVPLRGGTVQVSTPAGLSLEVRSVLPAGEENPAPRPPLPPVPLPVGEAFWWTLAALSAAALLVWLAVLWRGRRRQAPGAAERPALPPLDELAAALAGLADLPAPAAHTRLSLAFRRFLGRSLGFSAPEHTTSEIQRRLLSGNLPGGVARQAVELLRACDLVKFGRHEAGADRTRERVEAARRIAGEIDDALRPAEPAPLEAAG